ncbi:hypothetical protein PHYSODRAFT_355157 [Phytophthora sojae]|uniref:Granulins domain-containing protein n=1 Tax=Phytophthora sojae (strain P6497) TaxID=1094619 RepID=G4ZXT0_PHYSP|nr:hypothetical protein PHYSODRAFT_355157 [Phytophthora sojae]EGZ11888.1 hypothetical protein PHYSODRAFT_355157 [Phytophthora sojae]|eukprot:XP_009532221.1 hypothetical protein PHYSODRAFT_355157 [Phytophthora sojae]
MGGFWEAVCTGCCAGCCIACAEATCVPLCDGFARCCCGDRGFSCCSRPEPAYRRESSASYGRADSPLGEIVTVPVKMQPLTPQQETSFEPQRV